MENPYSVLGISENATDEQVKEAYRDLAKKYHPDNYDESPLKDLAERKMADINAAFDEIMNRRRGANGSGQQYSSQQGSQQGPYGYNTGPQENQASNFADIRRMIKDNRLVEAEELLDGVAANKRDAEWYFLKGTIYFSRGWLDDAATHFSSACRLNPNNPEYRAALNRITWQRQGNFGGSPRGGYRTNSMGQGGCSTCDICSGLICADCCCECMGGDLIPCC